MPGIKNKNIEVATKKLKALNFNSNSQLTLDPILKMPMSVRGNGFKEHENLNKILFKAILNKASQDKNMENKYS